MKIVVVIYSLAGGGAERVTTLLCNEWHSFGHDVCIMTLSDEKPTYNLDERIRIKQLRLSKDNRNLISGLFSNIRRAYILRKQLKQERPDVVVSMMSSANILMALSLIGNNNLVRIGSERVHPPTENIGFVRNLLRRYLYSKLDAIVVQTKKSQLWVKNFTNANEVCVIPNPIKLPVGASGSTLTTKILDKREKVILAVGRLEKQKGFNELIDIFADILTKDLFEDWSLVILGEGTLRERLEAQVNSKNIRDKIFLPGQIGNVHDWYLRADIFVLSSEFEGFPNSLVEAMAYGVSCVSYDCDTGPSDIIKSDNNGILVENQNVSSLKKALVYLMSNEEARQRFSRAAILVRDELESQAVANKWIDLFERLRK